MCGDTPPACSVSVQTKTQALFVSGSFSLGADHSTRIFARSKKFAVRVLFV